MDPITKSFVHALKGVNLPQSEKEAMRARLARLVAADRASSKAAPKTPKKRNVKGR